MVAEEGVVWEVYSWGQGWCVSESVRRERWRRFKPLHWDSNRLIVTQMPVSAFVTSPLVPCYSWELNPPPPHPSPHSVSLFICLPALSISFCLTLFLSAVSAEVILRFMFIPQRRPSMETACIIEADDKKSRKDTEKDEVARESWILSFVWYIWFSKVRENAKKKRNKRLNPHPLRVLLFVPLGYP